MRNQGEAQLKHVEEKIYHCLEQQKNLCFARIRSANEFSHFPCVQAPLGDTTSLLRRKQKQIQLEEAHQV